MWGPHLLLATGSVVPVVDAVVATGQVDDEPDDADHQRNDADDDRRNRIEEGLDAAIYTNPYAHCQAGRN